MGKEERLIAWLRGAGAVAIGYSGGVDSVYLAAAAIEALGAERVLGVTGRSASYPGAQWAAARAAAAAIGLEVVELDTNELADPNYAANPVNRCYFCKTELWDQVVPAARARGIDVVVDGTNADDLHGHRPGAAAAREHGVKSPLAELGFTKAEIREYSRQRGLPTAEQPSSPCLSSRIPFGTAVTTERLARIEAAESALRGLGLTTELRVRHHDDLARIEVGQAELSALFARDRLPAVRDAVLEAGYTRVAVDLRGFRSGSLSARAGGARAGGARAGGARAGGDRADRSQPPADSFRAALRAAGVDHDVEDCGGVALLTASAAAEFGDQELRLRVSALAFDHGFAFAAVELTEAAALDHASLSRD